MFEGYTIISYDYNLPERYSTLKRHYKIKGHHRQTKYISLIMST